MRCWRWPLGLSGAGVEAIRKRRSDAIMPECGGLDDLCTLTVSLSFVLTRAFGIFSHVMASSRMGQFIHET